MGTKKNHASSIKSRKEKIAISKARVNMYRSKVKKLCRKYLFIY